MPAGGAAAGGRRQVRRERLVDVRRLAELEDALAKIVAQFSDQTLNELARFADLNPSLERFAQVFHEDLSARLAAKLLSLTVKLWENDRDWAAYGPE